jgi:hypothetical protein
MPRADPSLLEIFVEPTGAAETWTWILVVGNGRPVKTGTVTATQDAAVAAARD